MEGRLSCGRKHYCKSSKCNRICHKQFISINVINHMQSLPWSSLSKWKKQCRTCHSWFYSCTKWKRNKSLQINWGRNRNLILFERMCKISPSLLFNIYISFFILFDFLPICSAYIFFYTYYLHFLMYICYFIVTIRKKKNLVCIQIDGTLVYHLYQSVQCSNITWHVRWMNGS